MIPLRLPQSAILKATIEDKQARVVFRKGSGYYLLLEKKESDKPQVSLVLKYAKAILKTPGAEFRHTPAAASSCQSLANSNSRNGSQSQCAAHGGNYGGATRRGRSGESRDNLAGFCRRSAGRSRFSGLPRPREHMGLETLATAVVTQQVTIDQGAQRTRADVPLDHFTCRTQPDLDSRATRPQGDRCFRCEREKMGCQEEREIPRGVGGSVSASS